MSKRVLVLHAYSATNKGDRLLLEETVALVEESLAPEPVDLWIVALHPHSFGAWADRSRVVSAREFVFRSLTSRFLKDLNADLIVAVGGGYLRFGTPTEALKTTLAHVSQVVASRRAGAPVAMFPQSIGPSRWMSRGLLRRLLNRASVIYVRDDRSRVELGGLATVNRVPDLALLGLDALPDSGSNIAENVIFTARSTRSATDVQLRSLAKKLGSEFSLVGYVQSSGHGNDDHTIMRSLGLERVLSETEYSAGDTRAVVVAVRLHAALMALRAGHYVIHLAYERKGFGAFQDLQLERFVHNVHDFDPEVVQEQVRELHTSAEARRRYLQAVQDAQSRFKLDRALIRRDISRLAR